MNDEDVEALYKRIEIAPDEVAEFPLWDFWDDEAELGCVGYNSEIDENALAVLKGIVAKKFNSDIAAELALPTQYVELLQSIFCSVGWAEYGSSPRGCWIDPGIDGERLVALFEARIRQHWQQD